ncbi:Piso0_005267 [Millerozyma farinosa CBS 7064]|uniref:Piso0_005267 protein n=1 Tax=Pichia sorbitophila (strain ATCC MYA-4447 / BCRC 22081 / CBS 7064 / NBRC 10061 / NRRL Y-12695) TaxID=559304 RepID=G8Y4N1_PICSO|nr:Piso0_005267 [Millerozyma farinosa CBS 7064]
MSDPINANPVVLDVSQLPTRSKKDQAEADFVDQNLVKNVLSLSFLERKHYEEEESTGDSESDSDMQISGDEKEDVEYFEEEEEEIDSQEIFDLISTISDPEHPLTLAQLAVVNLNDIEVKNDTRSKNSIAEVLIKITPTITHCSLATLIGLGIRVRLERCLPPRYRINIRIKENTHQSENQINKQLNDKERVAAACENDQLLGVISQMLSTCK